MQVETLADYLVELCESQNLSMRQASLKAGLSSETIGQIVRRGKVTRPRPETLRALADGLNGDFDLMMILAGHLDPPLPQDGKDPEVEKLARELIDEWYRLKKRNPEGALQIMRSTIIQAQALRVALEMEEREEVEAEVE